MFFASPVPRCRRRSACRRFRPQVHALEDRCLLSTLWTDFKLPDAQSSIAAITSGTFETGGGRSAMLPRDGDVWFTEPGAHKISGMSSTGAITEVDLPPNSIPVGLTVGSDGNLWFTDQGLQAIGTISPAGAVTEFPLPQGSGEALAGATPVDIVAGPGIWFTLANRSVLGSMTASGIFHAVNLGNVLPDDLTEGYDGNLWFIDRQRGLIGRATPQGTVAEFSLPGSGNVPTPSALVLGNDGNIWFTEGQSGTQIGVISASGNITTYDLPSGHAAFGIQTSLPGELWFTEQDRIGRFNTFSGLMTEFPVGVNPPPLFSAFPGLWFASGNTLSKLDESALPTADITGMVVNGPFPSIRLLAVFSAAAPVTQPGDQVTIDWGDGQSSAVTVTSNGSTGFQLIASHTSTVFAPSMIRATVVQPNGVEVQLNHANGFVYPSVFADVPTSGPQWSSNSQANTTSSAGDVAFGSAGRFVVILTQASFDESAIGFAFDGKASYFQGGSAVDPVSTWDIPWSSTTTHGTPGSPATTVGSGTQLSESMTSVPARNSGFVVVVLYQVSSGSAQETGSSSQQSNSSGSAQREVPTGVQVSVSSQTAQVVSSGTSSGSEETVAATAQAAIRSAVNYGSTPDRASENLSGDGEESTLEPSNARQLKVDSFRTGGMARSDSEDIKPALVGEPLRQAVPSEQDLLAIAYQVLASDGQKRDDASSAWIWLGRSLMGFVLGLVVAESLIWSLNPARRRQETEDLVAK